MKSILLYFYNLIIAFAALFCSFTSFAQAGELDIAFGTGGIVTTTVSAGSSSVNCIKLQADGKIVATGYANMLGSHSDFTIVRYNIDGSLDPTFNGDGIFSTTIGTGESTINSFAIKADGKIVAATSASVTKNCFALVQCKANGTFDSSFGDNGIVITSIGTREDYPRNIAIQTDGKILVWGHSFNLYNSDFALVRYLANGTLDSTFDTDGIVLTHFSTPVTHIASGIGIQKDGKIVGVGAYDGVMLIIRYNTDGSIDKSFGTSGIISTLGMGKFQYGSEPVIQADGKIIVAGGRYDGSLRVATIMRFNADGTFDSSFDTDGIVTTAVGSDASAFCSAGLQADGKIVAAGYTADVGGYNWNFLLSRYHTDGTLDTSFSMDGIATTAIGSYRDAAYSLAIQPFDGKIVVGGLTSNSFTLCNFALARYNSKNTSSIQNTTIATPNIRIDPNPFVIQTTLQSDVFLHNASIYIKNAIGQTIIKMENLSGHQILIERNNLPNGLYSLQLYEGKEFVSAQKLLIH